MAALCFGSFDKNLWRAIRKPNAVKETMWRWDDKRDICEVKCFDAGGGGVACIPPPPKKKKKTIRQDLTSDMDLSPPLYSLADQLVSESKGSAHSSRKH